MSEARVRPIPVPRKSKQKQTEKIGVTVDENVPVEGSIKSPVSPMDCNDYSKDKTFCTISQYQVGTTNENQNGACSPKGCPTAQPRNVDDDIYEKPGPICAPSGNDSADTPIYEEFNSDAAWQQELVAWFMAREFGNSMPLGTRPLPQATESRDSMSLSFMPSNLAQRASLVLQRLTAGSPNSKLLVDVGSVNSIPSVLNEKAESRINSMSLNEMDRDFLSLFGISAHQPDKRCSDSLVTCDSRHDSVLIPDTSLSKKSILEDSENNDEDHLREEFPVVSLRKGQAVTISVDREDGSLCWISGGTDKSVRSNNSCSEGHQRIHRRMLVLDLLRVNVDPKSRHVVHITTSPNCQHAKESPFSYACGSPQFAIALVTSIAKALNVYNMDILSTGNIGTLGGVLCVGKIMFRQQSLQPWVKCCALITESRHFIVVKEKDDTDKGNDGPVLEHSVDLRYVRELKQETAGDADGSRLLYMRFGTSATSSLFIQPACACSSSVKCVCSANGCEPCAAQFSGWQSVLENVVFETSQASNCLAEQLMSESDLPAIVDRVLSHLTLSHLTVEGLHRQAGRVRVASELIKTLKRDPWSLRFEASAKDGEVISAHDIISTLKKFFQTLDRPLLLTGVGDDSEQPLAAAWLGAHYNRFGVEARLAEYRKAFGMLHPVARRTLQAILLHLRTVAALEEQNRMNYLALAASWGPTLLCYQNKDFAGDAVKQNDANDAVSTLRLGDVLPHGKSIVAGAIGVVIDLLSEMDSICPFDAMPESVRRDAHVQDIAVRLYLQPQQHKQSGEITLQVEVDLSGVKSAASAKPEARAAGEYVPLNLNSRRKSSHAVHVAPRLTAEELIKHLATIDEGIAACSSKLSVWEYLAGGELRRPLVANTRLLDVCCSWASLEPESLCRDCKLVIEASPTEPEDVDMYTLLDNNQQLESESIMSLKMSIPCQFGGLWTQESFAENNIKLKNWMYVSDHELLIKPMKPAPTALVSASWSQEDRPSTSASAAAGSGSRAPTRSGGGSFKSFFSSALSHIHSTRASGRVKYSVPLKDILSVYGVYRSAAIAGCGTCGLVISSRSKATDVGETSGKSVFSTVHILDEQMRDRLLSHFHFYVFSSLQSSDSPKKQNDS